MAGRALVTGGAGFIGSHLVEGLLQSGYQVRVLDNLSTGRLVNLSSVAQEIEWIEGDIRDADRVKHAVLDCDVVFHQAALASVPASLKDPVATHEVCATGTLLLLHAAQQAGVSRFVYAGSSSCYGDLPGMAKRETDRLQPLSPYGAAKLAGEMYCESFFHSFGFETVRLRYFNVFGPRQDPDSPYSAVIPIFLTRMLRHQRPIVFGDGNQSRDFTHVSNVVQANLLAAQTEGIGGRVFNIANGAATTLRTLIACLNQDLGTEIEAQHEAPRPGDVRDSMADITAARHDLGYDPRVDFRTGLTQSIDYYRSLSSA